MDWNRRIGIRPPRARRHGNRWRASRPSRIAAPVPGWRQGSQRWGFPATLGLCQTSGNARAGWPLPALAFRRACRRGPRNSARRRWPSDCHRWALANASRLATGQRRKARPARLGLGKLPRPARRACFSRASLPEDLLAVWQHPGGQQHCGECTHPDRDVNDQQAA